MGTKHRRMLQTTTVAIFLSINVQITQNQNSRLLTIPLLSLTNWLVWWWQFQKLGRGLTSQWAKGIQITTKGAELLRIAGLVMLIGVKSSLFGLGVCL